MSSKYCLRNKTVHHHQQSKFSSSNEGDNNTEPLPARSQRATKRTINKTTRSSQSLTETNFNYFTDKLPNEVIIKIFSYLYEIDLARVLIVCKKFYQIGNDQNLWKQLYKDLFGTRKKVLVKIKENSFKFINEPVIESGNELMETDCNEDHVWKSAFVNFYKCVHVVQSLDKIKYFMKTNNKTGRNIIFTVKLEKAIEVARKERLRFILVHPGVYKNDDIIIDFDVKIIGLARDDSQYFYFDQSYFSFNSPDKLKSVTYLDSVQIINENQTTVKFTKLNSHDDFMPYFGYCSISFLPSTENSKGSAIEICGGASPTLEYCSIRSNCTSGASLNVSDEHTNPTVRNCFINDCENVGICISDHAMGKFEFNEVSKNALAGIWVKNKANPTIKCNLIHHGRDVGVFTFEKGLGIFDSNDIHSNRIAGFEIKGGANPTVVNCHIHHGLTGGIYIHENGKGQIMRNRIYANNLMGVWVQDSDPTVRDNEIYDGLQGGLYLFNEARGLILENNIYNNALAGIQVCSNANPIIKKNKIHHCHHSGIHVYEKGLGIIEDNEIYANKLADIWVTTQSSPTIRRNRIHSGKNIGVYFNDGGSGVVENNDIYDHLHAGVQIKNDCNPLIKSNKIWSSKNCGILISDNARGQIEDNEVFENNEAGIMVKSSSCPVIKGNKVYSNIDFGVKVSNCGKGLIEDNYVFMNQQANVNISEYSSPSLINNQIYDGYTSGIEITDGSDALVQSNKIFRNRFSAILINDSEPLLKDNQIFDNYDLIEKSINENVCLSQVCCSKAAPIHHIYRCLTCSNHMSLNLICLSCKNNCHANHNIEFWKIERFQCGCGSTNPCCKLIVKDDADANMVEIFDDKLKGSKMSSISAGRNQTLQ